MKYLKIITPFVLLIVNIGNFKHFYIEGETFGMFLSFVTVLLMLFYMDYNIKKTFKNENNKN